MKKIKQGFVLLTFSALIAACGGSSSSGKEEAPKQSPSVQVSGLKDNSSFRVELNSGEASLLINKNGTHLFAKEYEQSAGKKFDLTIINSSNSNCAFKPSGERDYSSTSPGRAAIIICNNEQQNDEDDGGTNNPAEKSDSILINPLVDRDDNDIGIVDFPLKKNGIAFTTVVVENAELPTAVFVTSRKGNLKIKSCNPEENPMGKDGEMMLNSQKEVCVEVSALQDAGVDYIRVAYKDEVEELPVVFDSTMGSELISIAALKNAAGELVGTPVAPLDTETVATTTIAIDNQKKINTINVTSKKGNLSITTCSPSSQPIGSDGDVMLDANDEVCLEVTATESKGVDALVVSYANEKEELSVVYDASAGVIAIQALVDAQDNVVGTSSSPLRSGVKAKAAIKIENALRASTIKVASEKGKLLLESCDPEMQPMDADGEIPLNDAGEACVYVRALDESGVDRLIVTYQGVQREQLVVFNTGAVSNNITVTPLSDSAGRVVGVVSAPLNRHVFAETLITVTDARPTDTVTVTSRKGALFFESCSPSIQPIGEDGEIMLNEDGEACLHVSIRTGEGVDTLVVDYQGERSELPVVYDASSGSNVIYIDQLKNINGGNVIGVVGTPLEKTDIARTTVFIEADELGGSVKVVAEKNNIRVDSCEPMSHPMSPDGEILLDENNEVCLTVRPRASAGLDYVLVEYVNSRTQVTETEKLPVVFWFDDRRFWIEPVLTLTDVSGNPEFGKKSTDSVIPINSNNDLTSPTEFAFAHLTLTDYTDAPVADAKIIYTVDENIAYLVPPVPYLPEKDEDGNEIRVGYRSTDLTNEDGVSDWVKVVCLAPGAARLEARVDGSILDPTYYEFQCGEKQL